jgi:GNAT superfamily N-acetyltransferase
MKLHIYRKSPKAEDYNKLRMTVGWPTYPISVVERALKNTYFTICVEDSDGNLIGMGRIIGDNAIYLHLQDVIVHPEWQRHGVGKMIVDELLTYVEKTAVTNTNVGLMCSKGREEFYKQFGFTERPSEKFGAGMIMVK